ncbi:MAG: DUF1993 domain-containing protein [Methylomonas sp.]|uniref:DUF1993 domain-containing protein n=1 Tax=Methylomonas sp. TaxID=418 RepID=UPI0025ED5A95|nr:DUF1993 domain-containing protein [Methylomonas sp.]MCK9608782.1 DUF1993 domain-containing protein [Methylomonas sp.]
MSAFMYAVTVPPILRSLANLRAILKKAIAHAEQKKIDPSVLVNARLYPDMYPLSRQVQIATDVAKGAAARLAGQEPLKYQDTESTLAELIARIDKTVALLESLTAEQINGSADKTILLPRHDRTSEFKGLDYLTDFVLPNIYFHVATAYAILRHNGVELGKQDFLGNI